MNNLLALAPTPSQLPGRHWNPNDHHGTNISAHDLKCLVVFLILCLVLWGVARVANGNWRPPSDSGGNTWT